MNNVRQECTIKTRTEEVVEVCFAERTSDTLILQLKWLIAKKNILKRKHPHITANMSTAVANVAHPDTRVNSLVRYRIIIREFSALPPVYDSLVVLLHGHLPSSLLLVSLAWDLCY